MEIAKLLQQKTTTSHPTVEGILTVCERWCTVFQLLS